MLGLTVKDIIIGGVAATSLGLGTFNTVSICKTKKRVKSCESYQNDIKTFQEKVNTFMDKSKSKDTAEVQEVKIEVVNNDDNNKK